MSERKNSLIALLIVFLALLIIGVLEMLVMGAENASPPEPMAQAVRKSLLYRDGVVVIWNRRGEAHWILGNSKLLTQKFLPGSLMKLVTAQAALNLGMNEKYRCEGHRPLGKIRQECWKPEGHGELDLTGALAHSCNLYFSRLGEQMGWEVLKQGLNQYAFQTTPIQNPSAEVLGSIAIGEDRNFLVSPLEMTRFWEQYLGGLGGAERQAIREGLVRAATEGTAQDGAIHRPILAKTGTAEALGEPYKTHGWYLGAFPPSDPQWAWMIFLKNAHGYREASALAGEIFKTIPGT